MHNIINLFRPVQLGKNLIFGVLHIIMCEKIEPLGGCMQFSYSTVCTECRRLVKVVTNFKIKFSMIEN
jgi:hypothetical protein